MSKRNQLQWPPHSSRRKCKHILHISPDHYNVCALHFICIAFSIMNYVQSINYGFEYTRTRTSAYVCVCARVALMYARKLECSDFVSLNHCRHSVNMVGAIIGWFLFTDVCISGLKKLSTKLLLERKKWQCVFYCE